MGFRFTARCPACDYKTSGLVVGDAKHALFTCRACRAIVNPEVRHFRANTPDCPACGVALAASGVIDPSATSLPILRNRPDADPKLAELLGLPKLPEPPPAKNPTCPRCEKVELAFDEELHFSMPIEPIWPKRGERIHGSFDEQGTLHVTQIGPVKATFEGPAPPKLANAVLELEVLAAEPFRLAYRKTIILDAESRIVDSVSAPKPTSIARRPSLEPEKAGAVLQRNRVALRVLLGGLVLLALGALVVGALEVRSLWRGHVLKALDPGLDAWRRRYPVSRKATGEPFLRGKVVPIDEENARVVDPFFHDLPDAVRPAAAGEVGTVLWLERSARDVSKGSARLPAWRRVWRVTLVDASDGTTVAIKYFKGSEPETDPDAETFGSEPAAEVAAWLASLPRK